MIIAFCLAPSNFTLSLQRKYQLKELTDVIVKPLSIMFVKSWRAGEMPQDWRKDSDTPVFKKGEQRYPGNYRLSSLT